MEGIAISPHPPSRSKCAAWAPVSPSAWVGLARIQFVALSTQRSMLSYVFPSHSTVGMENTSRLTLAKNPSTTGFTLIGPVSETFGDSEA